MLADVLKTYADRKISFLKFFLHHLRFVDHSLKNFERFSVHDELVFQQFGRRRSLDWNNFKIK
jgi:hypothetical protein